jgi:hypothetical protein
VVVNRGQTRLRRGRRDDVQFQETNDTASARTPSHPSLSRTPGMSPSGDRPSVNAACEVVDCTGLKRLPSRYGPCSDSRTESNLSSAHAEDTA